MVGYRHKHGVTVAASYTVKRTFRGISTERCSNCNFRLPNGVVRALVHLVRNTNKVDIKRNMINSIYYKYLVDQKAIEHTSVA